ncbi:MAG TPA: xanthine dehydrogenase family protein subunit M [Afifellaceae bacterium]|nr:xanthine dehydrogenase family protein subunit M [Afifellaceae bacterium]
MKPAPFAYARPASLDEALTLLADGGHGDARVLAGGQSLMPVMNFRLAEPDLLVDINGLSELASIEETDGSLRVGALVRQAELLASPLVRQHAPLLAMALPHVGHHAIRNRGTVGGSVALADPAAEIPACALALGATIHVAGRTGRRAVAAEAFFTGLYDTALEPGELVTALELPNARPGERFAFQELARRHGDYAMAGVAVAARVADVIEEIRIVFFAVADRPLRAPAAEQALAGSRPGDAQALASGRAAVAQLPTSGDLHAGAETKRHWAGVLLGRALAELEISA